MNEPTVDEAVVYARSAGVFGHIPAYTKDVLSVLAAEVERLRAKDASGFQPESHTEGLDDKWLILALRMLSYMDRDDVAAGLEAEVERLRAELKEARRIGAQAIGLLHDDR